MPSFAFSPAELSYLHTSLSSHPPIRPDSRLPTQFRPLNAETNVLPATNGSAHVSFSDGSEAIVGVKLEVEKTSGGGGNVKRDEEEGRMDVDAEEQRPRGKSTYISLSLSLPTLRDDDASLIFLEQMLLEPLLSSSLSDKLVINARWHWHVYVDVVLISPHGLATSYPLPLLSLCVYLALRDARVPKLKSVGEEDPVADDDWEAAVLLYARGKGKEGLDRPPFTLLVVVVGDNVVCDPGREELAVADAVVGVNIGVHEEGFRVLALRMIETPARDTMKGVGVGGETAEGVEVQGVWRPKLGGLRRGLLKVIVGAVLGESGTGGVAREVLDGLEGFLRAEKDMGG